MHLQDRRTNRDSHQDFEWFHILRDFRIFYIPGSKWQATPGTVSRGLLMTTGLYIDESVSLMKLLIKLNFNTLS